MHLYTTGWKKLVKTRTLPVFSVYMAAVRPWLFVAAVFAITLWQDNRGH
jgi:hypothetical protein